MPPVADGILVYERACLVRDSKGITFHPGQEAPDPLYHICKSLSGCHTPAAADLCAIDPLLRGARAIEKFTSFRSSPPLPANKPHLRRLAVLTVTGNPGHDAFFEGGLLDLFAQQEVGGGPGYFDGVLLEVRQLRGGPFEEALRWTLSMIDTLFNSSAMRVMLTLRSDSKTARPHSGLLMLTRTIYTLILICCRLADTVRDARPRRTPRRTP